MTLISFSAMEPDVLKTKMPTENFKAQSHELAV